MANYLNLLISLPRWALRRYQKLPFYGKVRPLHFVAQMLTAELIGRPLALDTPRDCFRYLISLPALQNLLGTHYIASHRGYNNISQCGRPIVCIRASAKGNVN